MDIELGLFKLRGDLWRTQVRVSLMVVVDAFLQVDGTTPALIASPMKNGSSCSGLGVSNGGIQACPTSPKKSIKKLRKEIY